MLKFVLLVTLLLTAGLAVGQPAVGQPAATAPSAANDATSKSRVNQRITQMHKRLKITPEQAQAWDAFAQAMRNNVTSIEQAYRQRASSVETMSATENLRNFAQIEQFRAQGLQGLSVSFETLYGTLSDEQKKTADAMFRHYEDRGEARRHDLKKPG